MNKSAIKNFAVNARNKLIEDVTQKAYELGITKDEIKEIDTFEGGFKVKGIGNGKVYKNYEIKQRDKLISNIKNKGFEQVIEEVSYTWFNRFIALRFMEINDYLPTGVRILSSIEKEKAEPDIIKEALNVDFDLEHKEYDKYKEIVYRLMDSNDTEDLYRYLLVKQCNQLGRIMPMVFEEIADYTELLLPDNLLSEGSVIRDLVVSIEEDDYKDQVEIIGWMYQYYISEKKDEVFAGLKKNKKITKENIPAATQLFTPKWIVKYMVENSLGRLWLESHPDENLQAQWKYYLEEAEQDPEVQERLDELKDPNLNPEQIKLLDPAMGSGHILVYAFDVLYDIYLKANYSERDIPKLILEKNLYGLDIDDRASQLAALALMMKARSKNRRIFRNKIYLNICSIQESNGITKEVIDYFANGDEELKKDIAYLVEVFHDAKEYGSILDIEEIDFDAVENRIEEIRNGETLDFYELQYREVVLERFSPFVKQTRIMSAKYDVVCTNPPYMGLTGMSIKLKKYLESNYQDYKWDTYSAFIKKCFKLVIEKGFISLINPSSFMFNTSFKKLRKEIIINNTIINMNYLGKNAFGSDMGTTSYVIKNFKISQYHSKYVDLFNYSSDDKSRKFFEKRNYYVTNQDNFLKVPGCTISYSVSEKIGNVFSSNRTIDEYAKTRPGLQTSDNNRFLRFWYEVDFNNIGISLDREDALKSDYKWFPHNKGGGYRKWYGNIDYIINFKDDGKELKHWLVNNPNDPSTKHWSRNLRNYDFYLKEGITFTAIGDFFSSRLNGKGFFFDTKGPMIFGEELKYICSYSNSKVFDMFNKILCQQLTKSVGSVDKVPIIITKKEFLYNEIIRRTCKNIDISKIDWDSFETSWDFQYHPLLRYSTLKNNFDVNRIETAFDKWIDNASEQFEQLKSNEEKLNQIFIEIYNLQDELTPEVEDKDITIQKADRERDIKSFISYAVGCMFGRYSLDEEGLAYAGGGFDVSKYKTFTPTKDNVLIIANDDYFEDDIVSRFVDFVQITFGQESLEENLDYIAETLGQKATETPRQTIRRYFLRDFYKDHVKTYKKRPIYWLFDSGKKDGFKALIYLHRYDTSTLARLRTDYLHKLQRMYESEVDRLDIIIESDLSAREKATARKKKDNINKQIEECLSYDQVIAHMAHQRLEIDLDDGVKVNYEKFQGVQVPQGEGRKALKANLLAKI